MERNHCSENAAAFKAAAASMIVDHDPEEIPGEDARDFLYGTGPDGEPIVHTSQIVESN